MQTQIGISNVYATTEQDQTGLARIQIITEQGSDSYEFAFQTIGGNYDLSVYTGNDVAFNILPSGTFSNGTIFSSISLLMKNITSASGTITVWLFDASLPSVRLASATCDASVLLTSYGYQNFAFTVPYTLTTGIDYNIGVSYVGATSQVYIYCYQPTQQMQTGVSNISGGSSGPTTEGLVGEYLLYNGYPGLMNNV